MSRQTLGVGRFAIEVRDHSPGFFLELRNLVLIRFCTTKQEGADLGLSMVSNPMETAQGQMAIQDLLEDGAVFRMALPLATSQPPIANPRQES